MSLTAIVRNAFARRQKMLERHLTEGETLQR